MLSMLFGSMLSYLFQSVVTSAGLERELGEGPFLLCFPSWKKSPKKGLGNEKRKFRIINSLYNLEAKIYLKKKSFLASVYSTMVFDVLQFDEQRCTVAPTQIQRKEGKEIGTKSHYNFHDTYCTTTTNKSTGKGRMENICRPGTPLSFVLRASAAETLVLQCDRFVGVLVAEVPGLRWCCRSALKLGSCSGE
jgi:hypothetical protein